MKKRFVSGTNEFHITHVMRSCPGTKITFRGAFPGESRLRGGMDRHKIGNLRFIPDDAVQIVIANHRADEFQTPFAESQRLHAGDRRALRQTRRRIRLQP